MTKIKIHYIYFQFSLPPPIHQKLPRSQARSHINFRTLIMKIKVVSRHDCSIRRCLATFLLLSSRQSFRAVFIPVPDGMPPSTTNQSNKYGVYLLRKFNWPEQRQEQHSTN